MQTLELVELSALASLHGTTFSTNRTPLPTEALAEIWTASRRRLDLWDDALSLAEGQSPDPAVIREILASEILARVWAAVATARDLHTGSHEAGPMARSALAGHASTSHRALRSIVSLGAQLRGQADQLNLLRLRCERWTDYLVAQVGPHSAAVRFAFDPRRATTLKLETLEENSDSGPQVGILLSAAIQRAFAADLREPSPNSEVNQRISAGILACFLPEMLSKDLAAEAPWQTRLEDLADRTEGMVSQLLQSE